MKHLARALTIILIGALFYTVTGAGAQTTIEGNPTCADLGLVGDGYVELKDDPPTLHAVELGGIVRIAYNDAQTVSGVLSLDVHEWGIAAVIVKGGPAANVWTFPDGTVSASGPLQAPLNNGGQVPDISHVTVCMCEKETTDTTVPPKDTTTTTTAPVTTTTEVPPSSTTTTISPPTTTLPDPPSSTTSPPGTSAEPPTSTSVTTPTPQTSPPNSNEPPSSTTTPTEITTQQTERPDELPHTGIPTEGIAAAGFLLVASGFLMRRLATER